MGTETTSPLSDVLFGKTRRAILALLYGHPDESFYVRQIARQARAGQGAVQRELASLERAGILSREARGHQVHYRVNQASPVFAELQQLILKSAGVADNLRAALASLAAGIRVAFVYGSMARAEQNKGSDIDLFVVGEVSFAEVVAALQKAQRDLGREINPTVYPVAEFRKKVRARHHFVSAVLREPKIFVKGDASELARVAGQRLAARSQSHAGRNTRTVRRGRQ